MHANLPVKRVLALRIRGATEIPDEVSYSYRSSRCHSTTAQGGRKSLKRERSVALRFSPARQVDKLLAVSRPIFLRALAGREGKDSTVRGNPQEWRQRSPSLQAFVLFLYGVEYTSGLSLDRDKRNGTDRCAGSCLQGCGRKREHPAEGSGIGGARYTLESDTCN